MSIYRKIAQDLRQAIDRGELKAGEKIPSVSELRKRYQVSHITALRACTELAKQNYILMRKGQGYFVGNSNPAKTMTLEHGVIGCFLRPLRPETEHDNFFNRINLGVQLECVDRRLNWLNLHCLSVLKSPPMESAIRQIEPDLLAHADQVDGFLLDERIPDFMIENIRKFTGKPIMLVNRRAEGGIDSAGPANRRNLRNGMNLAIRMGYDTFLYLNSGSSAYNCIEIRQSFEEYLEEHPDCAKRTSFIRDCSLVPMEETIQGIDAALDQNLPGARRMLILAESGSCCEQVIRHLEKRGFEPGKKIGLLAAMDYGYRKNLSPQPAALCTNPEAIGRLAVEKLLARITCPAQPPEHFTPEPDICFGETI